jgi:hypothetical protein
MADTITTFRPASSHAAPIPAALVHRGSPDACFVVTDSARQSIVTLTKNE